MKSRLEKAEELRSLHKNRGECLILPNAWDVASARLFEKSGFQAVATSSAGMMVSTGYVDGDPRGIEDYMKAVERIGSHITLPFSVDILDGLGHSIKELESTTRRIIKIGAVGLNIEDFDSESKKLISVETQVEKLKAVRRTGEALGIPLVINARTDALRYAEGSGKAKFSEAVKRAMSYRDAGADCVYPMGLADREQIASFIDAMEHFPVNVMIRKQLPSLNELKKLDVRRVSFGPSASYAAMGLLKRASKEILEHGSFSSLTEGALTFDELNDLVRRA